MPITENTSTTVISFNPNEIEAKIKKYQDSGTSDLELKNLLEAEGYTLDSFRYNPERYKWFEAISRKKIHESLRSERSNT